MSARASTLRRPQPLLRRHVRRRAERRAVLRQLRLVILGPVRERAGLVAVAELRDAEVEQLRQQLAGALDHHHVAALDVAMDDAEVVRAVDDLAQPPEQRAEDRRRDRAAAVDELVERRAAHVLHRDPQLAVGLGAERVDVRRVRVVEPRRELGLAQEPLDLRRRHRARRAAAP